MKNTKNNSLKPFFLIGIPFMFILGSLLHSAYDLLPNPILALIAPINESIWEHTKLAFVPTVLWYVLYLRFFGDAGAINIPEYCTSCLLSAITGIISVPLIFYFYTQAFGTELLWVDILILLAAVSLGQAVAYHSYKYSFAFKTSISVILLFVIWAIYIIFTLIPPNLPLFISG